MGDNTAIEWTDATWNPVRGCTIVSKGCTNCYAMRQAHRSSGAGGAYEGLTMLSKGGPVWTGEIRLVPELLEQPLHWKRPRRIFVNSMSDLFHEEVPDRFITQVWTIMAMAPQHVFQILTKRPRRMRNWLHDGLVFDHGFTAKPLENVWLGVSVEDQASADERIPLLLQTPAAVRWISAEPLLGPLNLEAHLAVRRWRADGRWYDAEEGTDGGTPTRLHWVVAGGESGPGARPMHPDWPRSLRDQCALAGVPFFFKQWGNWRTMTCSEGERWIGGGKRLPEGYRFEDHTSVYRLGKAIAGRHLDGRTHDEYPA